MISICGSAMFVSCAGTKGVFNVGSYNRLKVSGREF